MEYKALKDIAQITMGQSPDSSSYNEEGNGLPFFQGNADFGELYPTERVWCSAPKKVAKANDILISVRAPIGALNYAREECCIGRGLATISIDDPAERQYIFHLLKARHDELNIKGTGSTFKAISKGVLEDLQVPVISPAEKQHAMQIMDSAEHIIRKRKEELQRFDELIKARFVEMFGDQGKNQFSFTVGTLKDVADIYLGLTHTPAYVNDGRPFISVRDISSGVIDFSNCHYITEEEFQSLPTGARPKENDLLFCRVGTIGRPVIIPKGMPEFGSFVSVGFLRKKANVKNEYLKAWMEDPYFMKQVYDNVAGASQINLNTGWLKNFRILIPPIEIQEKFVRFVKQVDKSKVA